MTRQKFKKLTMALTIRICEKEGWKVDGKASLKIRSARPCDYEELIKKYGSYKNAWDWMKPVRDAYEMD